MSKIQRHYGMTSQLTGYYNIIKIWSCHYVKISKTLLKYPSHHKYHRYWIPPIFLTTRNFASTIYDFHEFFGYIFLLIF